MSIDAERKAAEKARGVLILLAPSTTYADHIVHPLRLAAGLASTGGSQGSSSQAELNYARSDATGALNALIRTLHTRPLSNLIISRGQNCRRCLASGARSLEGPANEKGCEKLSKSCDRRRAGSRLPGVTNQDDVPTFYCSSTLPAS